MRSLLLLTTLGILCVDGFVVNPTVSSVYHRRRAKNSVFALGVGEVIDAEFELDDTNDKEESSEAEHQSDQPSYVSLLDLSLNSGDAEWKKARIPFVDTTDGGKFIDGKLAFTIELDSVKYGIAIPFEPIVALTIEDSASGKVENLSPDDDENLEIMEIMAGQLQEHVGEDLVLKRTPRVLTIEGDLDKYTKNWKNDLTSDPISKEELLDDSDESEEWFLSFMKDELGDAAFQEVVEQPEYESLDSLNEELMDLFDVPGLGTRKEDLEGVQEMLKGMLQEDEISPFSEGLDGSNDEADALKLLSYKLDDGKIYSLVRILKQFALVGKYDENEEDPQQGIRFELLSEEEERIVIPKLEELCKSDLDAAGLFFLKP